MECGWKALECFFKIPRAEIWLVAASGRGKMRVGMTEMGMCCVVPTDAMQNLFKKKMAKIL